MHLEVRPERAALLHLPSDPGKPANDVTDGLLSGFEEHKAGNRDLESLAGKLRRRDWEE